MDRRKQAAVGYPFPRIPDSWDQQERHFAQGIQSLFDQIFGRISLQKIYPVGIVVFTGADQAPFSFGTWAAVTTGITGVYAWKRTA